jgi:hypothetical protein
MRKTLSAIFTLILLSPLILVTGHVETPSKEKTAVLKGTIYRDDKNHPVADALIILLDEKKTEEKDNSVETRTDAQGNFLFERVVEGKYLISIKTWHDTQEAVPCQFLAAKTKDKNSSVMVLKDKDKFVEQIFIKGFSVKANKENVKDFDIACKSLFAG